MTPNSYHIQRYGNIFLKHSKDLETNKLLTRFWTINQKIAYAEGINTEEMEEFNSLLPIAKGYYKEKHKYLKSLNRI